MIKYSILASGSTGNSIYIGSKDCNILIDAGLSGKRICESLDKVGVSISSINGILVTHEHDDHVKGLGVLARKYKIPIYANEETLNNLPKSVGNIEDSLLKVIETGKENNFGSLCIESFPISHDAVNPVGYTIKSKDIKISLVTDSGYVSEKIKNKIKGSNVYIFETNHNIEMLRMSSYPWSVKQRILSDIGHLSNESAGEALAEVITSDTKKIYLSHLSKENNTLEIARVSVENILREYGIGENQVKILDTYPDRPTKLDKIYSTVEIS